MAPFDWKNFFRQHPVFSPLTDIEIERLLDGEVSQERDVPKGEIIVREGDLGASIFVIATGAVTIKVSGPGSTQIPLVNLQSGEFFGEMALLQRLPRAATVAATEPTLLREIQGEPFIRLLQQHPDIEFRMLLVLSERLRRTGQHVVALAHKDVDKKFQLLDARFETQIKLLYAKLETETKAADTTLAATRIAAEQTSKDADRVIRSFERTRTELTYLSAIAGLIFAVVGGVAAFFGISTYEDISSAEQSVLQKAEYAEGAAMKIRNAESQIERLPTIDAVFKAYNRDILPRFVIQETNVDSEVAYRVLKQVILTGDWDITERMYIPISSAIFSKSVRGDNLRIVLEKVLQDDSISEPRVKILSYYLFLVSCVLDGDINDYRRIYRDFYEYVRNNQSEPAKQFISRSFDISTFEAYLKIVPIDGTMDQSTKEMLEKVRSVWNLIPGA